MKLNHVNLTVTDVPATRQFLEKYFGLRTMGNVKPGATFIAMSDEDGFVLTLMHAGSATEPEYPATFHIGFLQQSQAAVNELYQRLHGDGFDVEAPRHARGGLDLYVAAPGGFTIQVSG